MSLLLSKPRTKSTTAYCKQKKIPIPIKPLISFPDSSPEENIMLPLSPEILLKAKFIEDGIPACVLNKDRINREEKPLSSKNKVNIPKLNLNSAGLETLLEMREAHSIRESKFFDVQSGLERSEVYSRRSFTDKEDDEHHGCCQKECGKMVDDLRNINVLLEEKIDEFLREKEKWEQEIRRIICDKNNEIRHLEGELAQARKSVSIKDKYFSKVFQKTRDLYNKAGISSYAEQDFANPEEFLNWIESVEAELRKKIREGPPRNRNELGKENQNINLSRNYGTWQLALRSPKKGSLLEQSFDEGHLLGEIQELREIEKNLRQENEQLKEINRLKGEELEKTSSPTNEDNKTLKTLCDSLKQTNFELKEIILRLNNEKGVMEGEIIKLQHLLDLSKSETRESMNLVQELKERLKLVVI